MSLEGTDGLKLALVILQITITLSLQKEVNLELIKQ